MSSLYNYHNTRFLISLPDIACLPLDNGIEIAFAGRSNSGKSSAINAIVNKKKLARTSRTPGCTKLINIFEVEPGVRLVDFPGYGFAKVPKLIKTKWKKVLNTYLKTRNNLKAIVILMDIRHPMQNLDQLILKWAIEANTPVLILLSKSDKLSSTLRTTHLNIVRNMVKNFINVKVEIFSSYKYFGLDYLKTQLDIWFRKV